MRTSDSCSLARLACKLPRAALSSGAVALGGCMVVVNVHQMVLWSRDRPRPRLTGLYFRLPWRSIAKGYGPNTQPTVR
ncbi:UNVERIFIED_CONTAM: hypothetical protein FKN15_011710 [Acipenser sinensis]